MCPEAEDKYGNTFYLEPNMKEFTCLVLMQNQGRVIIPKKVRCYLDLEKGALLQLTVSKVSGAKKDD